MGLMGPRSRDFLQALTGADLSNEACPFGHFVELDIGYARVRAVRMTYVGELGWELYVPTEFAAGVFDTIMARGDAPRLTGFHALHSLRTASCYRHWGHDITDEDDPLAAGLGFAVALGWVECPDGAHIDSALLERDGFEVEVAGEPVAARLSLKPFYAPRRERVKG